MCRALPGPRCSKAARGFLEKAEAVLDAAKKSGDEERIESAIRRKNNAERKYQNTPEYENKIRQEAVDFMIKADAAREKGDNITANRYENKANGLEIEAEHKRNSRIETRAASKQNNLTTWTDSDGSKHSMSQGSAASIYNSEVIGDGVNVRNTRGNISKSENVNKVMEHASDGTKNAVEDFKKTGFKNTSRDYSGFSYAYNAHAEPKFTESSKSMLPKSAEMKETDENGKTVKKKVTLEVAEGDKLRKPATTLVRVHDDNGLTHEAKATIGTMKGDDGMYHTVLRLKGSSSLYGNRAAQDNIDASEKGALLKTDAPKWGETIILSSGPNKRKQGVETNKAMKKFTAKGKNYGNEKGVISKDLGVIIASRGTAKINRCVKRNERISQTSLDSGQNRNQTSTGRNRTHEA